MQRAPFDVPAGVACASFKSYHSACCGGGHSQHAFTDVSFSTHSSGELDVVAPCSCGDARLCAPLLCIMLAWAAYVMHIAICVKHIALCCPVVIQDYGPHWCVYVSMECTCEAYRYVRSTSLCVVLSEIHSLHVFLFHSLFVTFGNKLVCLC